jgi:hypothetical protein
MAWSLLGWPRNDPAAVCVFRECLLFIALWNGQKTLGDVCVRATAFRRADIWWICSHFLSRKFRYCEPDQFSKLSFGCAIVCESFLWTSAQITITLRHITWSVRPQRATTIGCSKMLRGADHLITWRLCWAAWGGGEAAESSSFSVSLKLKNSCENLSIRASELITFDKYMPAVFLAALIAHHTSTVTMRYRSLCNSLS